MPDTYVDLQYIEYLADTYNEHAQRIRTVGVALEAAAHVVKSVAFVGEVGGTAMVSYLENFQPNISYLSAAFAELSDELHTYGKRIGESTSEAPINNFGNAVFHPTLTSTGALSGDIANIEGTQSFHGKINFSDEHGAGDGGISSLPSDGDPPPTNDSNQSNDEVQFRLYAPRSTQVATRNSLHLYALIAQTIIQVEADVQRFEQELGGSVPKPKEAKQVATVARESPITVIPESDELEFEPHSLTKKWYGDWTRYDFEFRPGKKLVDETVFVRASIQIGGIEIAHIKCAIEIVDNTPNSAAVSATSLSPVENPLAAQKFQSQTTTPYQRIFISYSRRDTPIARAYKLAQTALGNQAFLDVDDLRAGENWQAALAEAIDEADIFQLFWSDYSADSKYCRYEWEYALQHRCPDNQCEAFIRPVYWRKPMPKVPDPLRHLNFKYVPFEAEGDMDKKQ